MADWNLMQLKSGTDIRGVAVEGTGQPVTLTDPAVEAITGGFVRWLTAHTGKDASTLTIAVGHDSRISADRISAAVSRALRAAGCNVRLVGLASTPAMFMTTVDGGMDAAVQITASHHPYERNGLKFFTPEGGLDSPDITALLEYAMAGDIPVAQVPGGESAYDYMPRYAEILRQKIRDGVGGGDKPLAGFRLVVDAGNGAGGFYATQVLEPLGADITGSQFLEPDGRFPNHIPNPENAIAMESVTAATLSAKADLGIIFDTDVDRAGCVGADGREINRNSLIALAAAIALEGNQGGTIVTDSVTSGGLRQFIEQTLGGVHHRFRRGYKNVINEAIRLNEAGVNAPLAIETSGHAALRENYFLDDGAYLITKIIIQLARLRQEGKDLSDLIGAMPLPAEEQELRFGITVPDFKDYGLEVIRQLEAFGQALSDWQMADDNREGIRFATENGQGWFLLRLSVHDPIMPMNIESNNPGGVKATAARLLPFFQQFEGLDIEPLTRFLG